MGRAPIPTWYFALVVVRRGHPKTVADGWGARREVPLELLGSSELSV